MRRLALVGLAALVALAGASGWWLAGALRPPPATTATAGPAWYFDGALLAATGADGAVQYRIEAPHITHDPADGAAVLDSPQLEWLQGEGPPLTIAADSGRVYAQRDRIALSGGVVIVDRSTGTRFEFRAPDLLVDAGRRVASTPSEVSLSSHHGEIRGIGLVADMNRGVIRIESAVRGRYVP